MENPKKPQNSFNVLSEHICKNLLDCADLGEIEDIIITNFKLESPDTDLKSAITLDLYVNLVIWLRENFQLDTAKFSLIFAAVHYLFESIRINQTALKDVILQFRNMLVFNEGNDEIPHKGLLSTLTIHEMKTATEFLLTGIEQHYKLVEFVYGYGRSQKTVEFDLSVETVATCDTPYPPPLCEAIDVNLYNECFAADGSARSHSAKSVDFDEELQNDIDRLDDAIGGEMARFAELSLETISRVLREECAHVFPSVTTEIEAKINDIESDFLKKICKIQK